MTRRAFDHVFNNVGISLLLQLGGNAGRTRGMEALQQLGLVARRQHDPTNDTLDACPRVGRRLVWFIWRHLTLIIVCKTQQQETEYRII